MCSILSGANPIQILQNLPITSRSKALELLAREFATYWQQTQTMYTLVEDLQGKHTWDRIQVSLNMVYPQNKYSLLPRKYVYVPLITF